MRGRWREEKYRQSVQWWDGFFHYIRESDFLMGKVNDFQADLECLTGELKLP
jgi:hypothetical protein